MRLRQPLPICPDTTTSLVILANGATNNLHLCREVPATGPGFLPSMLPEFAQKDTQANGRLQVWHTSNSRLGW